MIFRKLFFYLILVLLFSCSSNQRNQSEKAAITKSDRLWLSFARAMEQKDIVYLKQHSLDSVQCTECNCKESKDDMVRADFAFTYCLDKLMHLKKLTNREFSTTEYGNNEIQVIYSIKAPKAPEGAYDLIFLFQKNDTTYLFKGMIVT
jgi:hypothetical protein